MQPELERAKRLRDDLQAYTQKVYAMYQPAWNARADILKTIISLSSAAIVLVVAFSTSLRSLNVNAVWRYFTLLSFGLLTAALLTAFFGLWVGLRVHALQASFYGIGVTINDLMANSSSEEMFQESYGQVIQDLVEPIGKNDRTAETLFTISSCLFCAAMLLLAIVGFRQLLA